MTSTLRRGIYFFLSYAHSTPIADDVNADPDLWVRKFYDDLTKRVKSHARRAEQFDLGFVDYELPLDSDWEEQLSQALSAAEVFVWLYSPSYLTRPWALREREAFRQRLATAGTAESSGHIQPVLWIPYEADDDDPDLAAALRLGEDSPAYAENGLRAMGKLQIYRKEYGDVVDKLARDIVRVAERFPLGPSEAPALSEPVHPPQTKTEFVIAVLAPTLRELPADREPAPYASSAADWRPFVGDQERPIAEYAVNVAERLGLATRLADFAADRDLLARCPGVILVDPWMLADPALARRLEAAIDGFREWVTPFVLVNRHDAQYQMRGAELADQLAAMLARPEQNEAVDGRRVRVARDAEGFVQLMPMVVAQARRRFLRREPQQ